MIDPVLEKDIEMMHKLQEVWKQYLDIISETLKMKSIPPEKEKEFMDIKSTIAMYHDEFHELAHEDPQTAQNMISLVARTISLKHLQRLSAAEIKKIEIEWHEVNFLLNNVIGELEEKRERTLEIKLYAYKGKKCINNIGYFFSSVYHNMFVRLVVILAILFGALLGVDHAWGEQLNDFVPYRLLHDNVLVHLKNLLK